MKNLLAIPLMLIPIIVYICCMMWSGLTHSVISYTTLVGPTVHFSAGDCLIAAGLVALAAELGKATVYRPLVMIDHAGSVVLLVAMAILHISMDIFGSAVFALLVLMQAIDVVIGVVISIMVARRDIGFGIPSA